MNNQLVLVKGLHPGIILERELKRRKLAKGKFALSINEFPQTLVAIMKGKRRMNPALSLKIEKALDMGEGDLMILQVFFDIEQEKKKQSQNYHPDLSVFRPVIFWDTDMKSIDWNKNRPAVVRRVFEWGNEQEINEIIRFYGENSILSVLEADKGLSSVVDENMKKYLLNR